MKKLIFFTTFSILISEVGICVSSIEIKNIGVVKEVYFSPLFFLFIPLSIFLILIFLRKRKTRKEEEFDC